MTIFCDTSVLVAAAVLSHEHHAPAFALVEKVTSRRIKGWVAAHTLAEMYAVLTRLPVSPRIHPEEAARIVQENVVSHFSVQALHAKDYVAVLRAAAGHRLTGGIVYDALLLSCVEKTKADRIYTFNVTDFRRIAPHLEKIIAAP